MAQQQAAEQDTGAVFDHLVEQSRLRASGTLSTTDRGRYRRLKLHRERAPQARPDVMREMVPWIPDELRAVVRGMLTGERPWPLYLYGDSGRGKTSLALLMLDFCGPTPPQTGTRPERVREWLAGYADVRWIPGLKIDADKGRLPWSHEGSGGEYAWDTLLKAVERAPLFVFDEIGVGATTADFRLDAVLEVIGLRCVNPVRPFVVTGNVSPEELAKIYDHRVARRVTWGTVVRWTKEEPQIVVWERRTDGTFTNVPGK